MTHIIIAGLGNPGNDYEKTRHNIGFMIIDAIAQNFNFPAFSSKFSSFVANKIVNSQKITLIKPQTYMNLSGEALSKAMHFYKIPSEDLIVIHDDLDLQFSRIKMKIGGGSGGHNGIKSIDQHIGQNYYRVRFGIGKSEHKETSNFVLSSFTKEEFLIIDKIILSILENFDLMISKKIPMFMNKLSSNSKVFE